MSAGAAPHRLRPFDRGALDGPVDEVARGLLNSVVAVDDGRWGRVVEVEAYGGADDPASHAQRGATARNASMFASAGVLYVYRSYGLHWCANVVVGARDSAAAVLLRAVEPLEGLAAMHAVRAAVRRPEDLANGPGKLCSALGITGEDDGVDLLAAGSRVRLCSDGTPPPERPRVTARVGITRAEERPWRFLVPDSRWVSRGRPAHVA